MFEYLMPSLVTFTPRYSLLDQTCRLVVKRQIEYGNERNVPWGVSESAFNGRDLHFTYQYSAFGVPGLGMKRGLSEELVIAPYATALAAMYLPHAAVENFARLEKKAHWACSVFTKRSISRRSGWRKVKMLRWYAATWRTIKVCS